MKSNIKSGDYFLLPFSGSRLSRLIRTLSEKQRGHWDVVDVSGNTIQRVQLEACHRVSPSEVRRIIGSKCQPCRGNGWVVTPQWLGGTQSPCRACNGTGKSNT